MTPVLRAGLCMKHPALLAVLVCASLSVVSPPRIPQEKELAEGHPVRLEPLHRY